MVCGARTLGTLLGLLGLAGCSSVSPSEPLGVSEREEIVGGTNDSTHKGVFGIVIQNAAICSGSLIAPNLVLTARHCVSELSTGGDQVDCADTTFTPTFPASGFDLTWAQNLNSDVPQDSIYGATEVRVSGSNEVCGNDVALIILDANVPSSDAAVIEPRIDEDPETGEAFSAIGYGLNDPDDQTGASAGVRRQAGGLNVGCVGAVECAGSNARNSEWAAYTPVCSGDSGGPALDAEGRVIGVASRADATCYVALYGSVSSFKDMIVDAAVDAAEQGGYDPPAWTGTEPVDGGVPDAGMPDAGSASGGSSSGGTSGSGGTGGTGGGGRGGSGGSGGSGATAGSGGSGNTGSAGRGSAGRASMPSDAGAPPPDSGVTDAGTPSQLGPELGEDCTSVCSGDLLCYSETGKPPGQCVPPCSPSNRTCPSGLECNTAMGACVPEDDSTPDDDTDHSAGCGCRVADPRAGGAWGILGLFAALGATMRRRHRSLQARS
jgi:MYXO-CTERM domain-containing protein